MLGLQSWKGRETELEESIFQAEVAVFAKAFRLKFPQPSEGKCSGRRIQRVMRLKTTSGFIGQFKELGFYFACNGKPLKGLSRMADLFVYIKGHFGYCLMVKWDERERE